MMCIFSTLVSYVADTNIFARSSAGGKQFLVYSMEYKANSELAMILPLPTPVSPPEDAVRFIDLSGYPLFFEDMSTGFTFYLTRGQPLPATFDGAATLKVQEVGSFEASFVPRLQDFARLDSRFRLPDQAWGQLPQYADYAFAVFKLQAGAKHVHPMAFEFPTRRPQELFFPTVHVHDGVVEAEAYFDHSLYFQIPQRQDDLQGSSDSTYRNSDGPANQFMEISRTQGIVEADTVIQMKPMFGQHDNTDVVITHEPVH